MMLPSGVRRRLPRGGQTRTPMVDLWPADPRGDMLQGFILVPQEFVNPPPHSEAERKFTAFIDEKLKAWVAWRAKKGWILNGEIAVDGPHDSPSPESGADPIEPGFKRYIATARFTRTSPLWFPADGVKQILDQADMYGVDLRDSSEVKDYGGTPGVASIEDNTPAHDPMQFAEERRQRLGLKRADLLWKPLDK